MKEVILKKTNGVVSIIEKTEENVEKLNNKHLYTTSCSLETFRKCQKIFGKKKLIRDYDFITDGYQVFDSDSKIVNFYVNECKNCKISYQHTKTSKEALDDRQKRNELMKAYFDAITIEEACSVQDDLIARGNLILEDNYGYDLMDKVKIKRM